MSTASTRASVLKEPGVRESDRKSYDVYGTCNTVVAKQEGVWESFAGQKIRSLVLDDQCVCWWELLPVRSKGNCTNKCVAAYLTSGYGWGTGSL